MDTKPELTDQAIEDEIDAMAEDIKVDQNVIEVRKKILPQDQWRVSDDDISNLLYNSDDDIIVF